MPDRITEVLAVDRLRGHPFLPPDDVMATVPKLYATESVLTKDKLFVLHYFVASADWWIAEVDPTSWLAFGFANLGDPQNAEWGYVDLLELGTVTVSPRGTGAFASAVFTVERDLYWTPTLAATVLSDRFGR